LSDLSDSGLTTGTGVAGRRRFRPRPPIDSRLISFANNKWGLLYKQHLFKDIKTLEGIQTIDSVKDDKNPRTMEKW